MIFVNRLNTGCLRLTVGFSMVESALTFHTLQGFLTTAGSI